MLPKITFPLFEIKIPSSGILTKMRPMTVKEEKILIMAKESKDKADVMIAVKQIVNNCFVEEIHIDNLTIFDIEYIFVKISAQSISNIVKVAYRDNEDDQLYDFEIDLNKVEVVTDQTLDKDHDINITPDTTIRMKYPTSKIYEEPEFRNVPAQDIIEELTVRSFSKLFQGETMFDFTTVSLDEKREFFQGLPPKSSNTLKNFVINMPRLNYVIEYTNSKGTKRKIVLSTLNDFFTLY